MLSQQHRAMLVRNTTRRLIAELRMVDDVEIILVTPDDDVMQWANEWGVSALSERPIKTPRDILAKGVHAMAQKQIAQDKLNMALASARRVIMGNPKHERLTTLMVIPADLAWFSHEDALAMIKLAETHPACVVIAPDWQGLGTNAILLKPPDAIDFCYGENSATAHANAAQNANIPTFIYQSSAVALDLDYPNDLILYKVAPYML